MALDVGRKRIGLAVSDALGLTAQGMDTLQRRSPKDDIERICRLARERKVTMFLVGLPLHMSGDESEMAAFVRQFATKLEAAAGIAVRYQDERLTSVEAESRMQEQGLSLQRMLKEKRKGAVDRMAAVILLEDYLRSVQAKE
jgi:putative Holliday junction resolvase